MLKFSTFTGAHNKENRGEERNQLEPDIGASQLSRCWGTTDTVTLSQREEEEGEETSVENEKRYTELRKTQISREKE